METDSNKCPKCSAVVPKQNIALHQLRCSRVQQQQQKQQEKNLTPSVKKKTKKPLSTQKQTKSKSLNGETEEDIDAILNEFTKLNSSCQYNQCKTSVKTLGQKCHFCSMMFCLTHHMAEIHGCGTAAKIKARQDIAKYHDSKPRPMNQTKKAQVQNKLNKKLNEMEDERKRKSKDNALLTI